MRFVRFIAILLVAFSFISIKAEKSREVIVNGRVALYESVVEECGGDTLKANEISRPVPYKSAYLSDGRVAVEKIYNRLHPAWICLSIAFLCLILSLVAKWPSGLYCLVWVLFVAECIDFGLRWTLGEAFPLQTGTDTFACAAMLLALLNLLLFRQYGSRITLALAIVICALTLLQIFMGSHPAVRYLNPSLSSPWLVVHVPLVIGAYSLFIAATVAAIVGPPGRKVYICLLAGEIMLGLGIVCGSLWASQAWQRYWGWDPKETAALVTFIIYLLILVCWKLNLLRLGQRRWAVIVGFAGVLFTWFFVTKGLHSYW